MNHLWLAFSLAGMAVTAALTSAAVGIAFAAGRGALTRLAPAAQARLLLAAALAPALVSAMLLSAWASDVAFGGGHHRCAQHLGAALPAAAVRGLACLLAARLTWAALRTGARLRRARAARRALDAAATRRADGVAVLPFAQPQAFVLGCVRPTLYVSRGLFAVSGRRGSQAVLAHERAHARRRDPLRRLIASLALALHLPGVAAALERALGRAQELAADAEAAGVLGGDGVRIAEVLVRLARLRAVRPAAAVGWHGGDGDLSARVAALLDGGARPDRPRAAAFAAVAVLAWLAALLAAAPLHQAGEALLALLAR